MVSAEDLAAALGQPGLVLVDCRHALADADAGERGLARAHLPGAGHAHLDRDLSDHRKPACAGPAPAARRRRLSAARWRGWASRPTRRWWPTTPATARWPRRGSGGCCALMGHARVAVLDGGVRRLASAGAADGNDGAGRSCRATTKALRRRAQVASARTSRPAPGRSARLAARRARAGALPRRGGAARSGGRAHPGRA